MDIVFYKLPGDDPDECNRLTGKIADDLKEGNENVRYKFVIALIGENRTTIGYIFTRGLEHRAVARGVINKDRGDQFMGAGQFNYEKIPKLFWGSTTCFNLYGHDEPLDRKEGDRILAEFKTSVEALKIPQG